MPEISGLQVSRTIKEQPDYQSLPIILVSAWFCGKASQVLICKASS